MNWQYRENTKTCAALHYAGEYVISDRIEYCILSWRPKGKHIFLGRFNSVVKAKERAESHNLNIDP